MRRPRRGASLLRSRRSLVLLTLVMAMAGLLQLNGVLTPNLGAVAQAATAQPPPPAPGGTPPPPLAASRRDLAPAESPDQPPQPITISVPPGSTPQSRLDA